MQRMRDDGQDKAKIHPLTKFKKCSMPWCRAVLPKNTPRFTGKIIDHVTGEVKYKERLCRRCYLMMSKDEEIKEYNPFKVPLSETEVEDRHQRAVSGKK